MAGMPDAQAKVMEGQYSLDDLLQQYADAQQKAFVADQLATRLKDAIIEKCIHEGRKTAGEDKYVLRSDLYDKNIQYRRTEWFQTDYNDVVEELVATYRQQDNMAAVQAINQCVDRHTVRRLRSFLDV